MSREFSSILTILKSSGISQETKVLKDSLGKLISLGNTGFDISDALPYIIKILPVNDIILKKLCCILLMKYGRANPDVILLTHNTIFNEFNDPNPLIKCLALKTACHLRDENYDKILSSGLENSSAPVRRTAVLNCAKVKAFQDNNWEVQTVENLYKTLRDDDPLVVTNCLVSLDEILLNEQGVALNRNIVNHLLNNINRFTRWGQVTTLNILKRYQPKTELDLFDMLNVLDPLFNSNTCSVVIETFRLFKKLLSNENAQLLNIALERTLQSLKKFLIGDNPELIYLILQFVNIEMKGIGTAPVQCLLPSLLCKYGEHSNIKTMKMQILSKIVCEENVNNIYQDICINLTDSDVQLACSSVTALGEIAMKFNLNQYPFVVLKLLKLLNLSSDEHKSKVLWVLQQLNLQELEDKSLLVRQVRRFQYQTLNDSDSKCSFLCLLGDYGEAIPDAPYILEEIGLNYDKDNQASLTLGLSMMICALKLFFKRPSECQPILGRIFEILYKQNCPELQSEVNYYYRLLKHDISLCQKMIGCNSN